MLTGRPGRGDPCAAVTVIVLLPVATRTLVGLATNGIATRSAGEPQLIKRPPSRLTLGYRDVEVPPATLNCHVRQLPLYESGWKCLATVAAPLGIDARGSSVNGELVAISVGIVPGPAP